ncbi:hypothetical protein PtA15_2A348 [Puccinia triticina]|uniref:XPA C-terminal domain-containing protein n=1 Tax=Puccinia triticina TaxID=208348 RepID=A0ABY7CB76_9BASI|nr:uncharacterized protein PtA15_2A348 [Puccinia triticina]WAQ82035.1 hypothetical protein PtA15_2A348 [Puccinia triticina]WAR52907.1 hypothetical protein PtB15_2B335 [Puccinia triticina]
MEPSSSSSTANQPGEPRSLRNNRFLAKAKIRNNQITFRDDGDPTPSSSTSTRDSSRKRTRDGGSLADDGARSAAPSKADPASLKPLPKRVRTFVDYDLSTMTNSKGGFLLDNEQDDPRLIKQRQQIEELKKQRLKQAERLSQAPNLSLDKSQNPKCTVCGSVELDIQLFQVFKVPVCRKCKNEHPERFSLLTKTECKQDYLLTDPELKDSELLPHLLKPNPHQSTYSNMMLFLREQVEAYAFSERKWGSAEALDEEFERRETAKKELKNRKFEAQLRELRKKTRSNVWHRRQEAVHVHSFEAVEQPSPSGTLIQKCSGCGLQNEVEIF